jgi:MFS family permease
MLRVATMATGSSDPIIGRRLFTPAFIALGIAELAYFTAAGILIPTTPLFAAGPLGADEAGVGLTIGAFSVTALLLRPIAGRAADVRGRRPLLVWGAMLCALVTIGHLFATDLAVLIGLRLLLGVAEAFFFVAGFAMVADLAPPGRAGEALSYNSLALYLGIAVGPGLGEQLVAWGGYSLAWIGAAGLSLVAGGIALAMRESATLVTDPGPLRLVHRRALWPSIGLFTGIVGMSGFLAFVAIWADRLGMAGSGSVLLLFGAIVIGTRILFATLPDRVRPFRLAAAALGLIQVGLAIIGFVPTVTGLYVGAALCAVGVAFTTPAFFAAIIERVPPSETGVALGTTSLFLDLAFGGGPAFLGFVALSTGLSGGFGILALVVGLGAVGTAWAAVRAERRRVTTEAPVAAT